jgi:hypothetical protein
MGLNGSKEKLASRSQYGHYLPAKQPHYMAELKSSSAGVLIDERIVRALDKRRPIGQSRTAWVNYLLQYAITHHPEVVDVREYD